MEVGDDEVCDEDVRVVWVVEEVGVVCVVDEVLVVL